MNRRFLGQPLGRFVARQSALAFCFLIRYKAHRHGHNKFMSSVQSLGNVKMKFIRLSRSGEMRKMVSG